ncbi:uncharacterized protein METZ01_LOCUS408886, partial [marine metagenome]
VPTPASVKISSSNEWLNLPSMKKTFSTPAATALT